MTNVDVIQLERKNKMHSFLVRYLSMKVSSLKDFLHKSLLNVLSRNNKGDLLKGFIQYNFPTTVFSLLIPLQSHL